jgi:hypothetical protein
MLSNPLANYVENGDSRNNNTANSSTPRSISILPILINANTIENDNTGLLGIIGAELEWITFFDNVVPDASTVSIVLENSCGQVHTYHVKGGIARYLGSGDQHDRSYDYLAQSVSITKALDHVDQVAVSHGSSMATKSEEMTGTTAGEEDGLFCSYQITVYPTEEYEETFHTGLAYVYTFTTVALAVTSIVLFLIYTVLVDRRQKQVMDSAARSNAIIKSLFPAVIRRRLFGATTQSSLQNDGIAMSVKHSLGLRRRRPIQRGDAHNPKTRLTNFLTSTSPNEAYSMEHQNDEPIAEMFSNTTVVRISSLALCIVYTICVSLIFLIRLCFFRT